MNEQRLIDALRARAASDARRFREQYPNDRPNERWIDNSYTAALPLAKDDSQFDPGSAVDPRLLAAYKAEIESVLGVAITGEASERDRGQGDELVQQPTPGEN